MMNDNVLHVLVHIFEHHVKDREDQSISMEVLIDDLLEAGFEQNTVYEAVDWLREIIALYSAEGEHTDRHSDAIRVFSNEEMLILNTEVRGFILYLERAGILDAVTRERVINRLLAANDVSIELEHAKLITLLVLDHEREERPQNLHAMESLLDVQEQDRLH